MIYSCTVEPQMNTRHTFAKCLTNVANTNSRQNVANVSFARSCIKYLGHVVGSGELRVDPDKVSAVAGWVAPRDIKGV